MVTSVDLNSRGIPPGDQTDTLQVSTTSDYHALNTEQVSSMISRAGMDQTVKAADIKLASMVDTNQDKILGAVVYKLEENASFPEYQISKSQDFPPSLEYRPRPVRQPLTLPPLQD